MKPIIADNLTGYIHKIFWLRLSLVEAELEMSQMAG